MREMLLNTDILPEPLFNLIRTSQMRVHETEAGILLEPVENLTFWETINLARGMYNDGKLSVDGFLSEKRAEEAER